MSTPKLAGIRFFLVRKPFDKHLIFYRVCGDTLDIVRIVHGMRDLPRRLLDPPGADASAGILLRRSDDILHREEIPSRLPVFPVHLACQISESTCRPTKTSPPA